MAALGAVELQITTQIELELGDGFIERAAQG
jgi:hypothetical protein